MPSTGSFFSPAAAVCAPAPSPFPRARRRSLSPSFPAPCHRVRPAFCCPFSRGGRGGDAGAPTRWQASRGDVLRRVKGGGKAAPVRTGKRGGSTPPTCCPASPHKKTGRGAQRPSRPRISPTGAVCAPVPSPSFLSAHSHCEGKKECGSSAPPTSPQSQHSHCEGRKRSV